MQLWHPLHIGPVPFDNQCHSEHQTLFSGGFHGLHVTPLLKGCLRKYYAQTFYLHYAHTGATHFSFNSIAITHVCQLLYQKFDACMPYMHARIYYHKHVVTIGTMSELRSKWVNKSLLMHCSFCIAQKQSQKVRNPKFSWGGGHDPRPPKQAPYARLNRMLEPPFSKF